MVPTRRLGGPPLDHRRAQQPDEQVVERQPAKWIAKSPRRPAVTEQRDQNEKSQFPAILAHESQAILDQTGQSATPGTNPQ